MLKLDKYAIRRILREVDTKELACALISTLPEIKTLIYSNMSKRAAQMLEEDIQYIGELDKKTILICQRRIIQKTQRLIAERLIERTPDGRYTVYPEPWEMENNIHEEESKQIEYTKKDLTFKIISIISLSLIFTGIIIYVAKYVERQKVDRMLTRPSVSFTAHQN